MIGLGLGLCSISNKIYGSFTPLSIPNLALWLDAADTATITHTSNAVSAWSDKSGNGNNATQATSINRPTTNTRTINGKNVIDFDGTNDLMPITLTTISSLTQGASTSFVVSARDSGLVFRPFIGESSAAAQRFGFYGDANVAGTEYGFVHAANNTQPRVGTLGTTPTIQMGIRNGTTAQIYLNNGQTVSNTSAVNFTLTNLQVGQNTNTDGAVAEIIVYNRVLTDSEIDQIGGYLAGKWGLSWANKSTEVYSADYFDYEGSTFAWYGSPTGDNGFYDSVDNKTWVCYESWSGLKRIVYVRLYDHSTNSWSQRYLVCISNIANDDHGVPAMIMDANGRVQLFFGPHNGPMQYAVTTNPRDPSSWQIRPNFGGAEYSYPHPVTTSSRLALLMRKRLTASSKSVGAYYRSTAISGSTVTWSSELVFADLGTDSRYYIGSVVAQGDDIHFVVTYSDYLDNFRVNIYYLILNTTTDTIRNIDNSYSVGSGSWPINLADHNTYFRIYTHASGYSGNVPSMCLDNNNRPHVTFNNYLISGGLWVNSDLMYMNWNGSSWSTPEIVGATSYRYDDTGLTHIGNGDIQILYPYDLPAANVIRGGDMYVRSRIAGVWNTATIIKNQSIPYGLDRAKAVFNGTASFRWMFLEAAPTVQWDGIDGSSDLKAGFQRLFGYGDNGIISGAAVVKNITLSATQISDGRSVGDTVAIIYGDAARNDYTIISDPDNKFSISGNLLKLSSAVNSTIKSSHSVTIQASLRGQTTQKTFNLEVVPSDSLMDKMICEFPLTENSGRVINDSSLRKLNGSFSFGTTASYSTDPSWESTGLLFGNTGNRFVSVPAADFLTSQNLHIFVAFRNTSGTVASIVNRRGFNGTTEQNWTILSDTRRLRVITYNASGGIVSNNVTATDVLTDGVWNGLEVIFNGTSLTVNINGTTVISVTMSAALVASGKTGPLNIGSFFTDTTSYNGRVGYLALYNSVLTGADLTSAKNRATSNMSAKGVTITL